MPVLEKLSKPSESRHWTDSIPLEYHYTMGVAGEEFRRELKDNGRFLTSKCPKCKTKYLPTRMYCPTCFVETKDREAVNMPGYVYSITTITRNREGREGSSLVLALVKFEDVKGGIVHRLQLEDTEKAHIGTRVWPVFRPSSERTGALTDILFFKTA